MYRPKILLRRNGMSSLSATMLSSRDLLQPKTGVSRCDQQAAAFKAAAFAFMKRFPSLEDLEQRQPILFLFHAQVVAVVSESCHQDQLHVAFGAVPG